MRNKWKRKIQDLQKSGNECYTAVSGEADSSDLFKLGFR
jgi:hypothetical protein